MRNKQNQKNWKLTLLLVSAIFLGVIAKAQTINTIAGITYSGTPTWADGDGFTTARLYNPSGVAFDNSGNIYIADRDNHRIRKMSSSGWFSPLAGTGTAGAAVDGAGASAVFNGPIDIVYDPNTAFLYVCDFSNGKIRKVNPTTGVTSTLASGFNKPSGIAYYFDASTSTGYLYVADRSNRKIKKINLSTNAITAIAGSGAAPIPGVTNGYSGDGGSALSATLGLPNSVAVDASGNIYFSDEQFHVVRKVYNSGTLLTIAGSASGAGMGDGTANSAKMDIPSGVAVDNSTGNIYISDLNNYRIRKLTPETVASGGTSISTYGTMSTYVGNGTLSPSGDGGLPSAAQIGATQRLRFDSHGDLFIPSNGKFIRKIDVDLNITGTLANLCIGATETLTASVSGGTWSSSNASIANVSSTGVVTGVSTGTVTITYTANASTDYGSFVVSSPITVRSLPNPGTITISSPSPICAGSTRTIGTTGTTGGTWSSSDATYFLSPAFLSTAAGTLPAAGGTITTNAGITSASAGTIIYTVSNAYCSASATMDITILPTAGTITGPVEVCAGSTITLANALAGGTWIGTTAATVSSAGVVTGVAAGPATISYSYTSASCGTHYATYDITVNPLPDAGAIMGPWEVCEGATITVNNPLGDELGVWSTTADYAIITSSGNTSTGGIYANVYGFAVGTNDISYTVTNSYGCTAANGWTITVRPRPFAGALPDISVCVGADIHEVNATGDEGGTWAITFTGTTPGAVLGTTSSAGSIYANVHGASTASTTGTNTLSYTVTNSYGCTASVSKVITVNPLPDPGTITETYGRSTICAPHGIYSTLNLSDAVTGGTWNSSNTMVAVVSTSGVVSGTAYLTPGTAIISYSVTNTCGTSYATYNVTAESNPDPGAITPDAGYSSTITSTSPTNIDVHLASSILGTWDYTVISGTASINLATSYGTGQHVSKVSGSGSTGEFDITYTLSNSCATTSAHFTITVAAGRGIASATGGSEESISSLKTYPNPTTGVVTLELPEQNDNTELMIFDVSGKVVETKTTNDAKISFDMSGYSKGVYMIQVKSGDHTYNEKVVFQ